MTIKHKVLKDFQHLTSDKRIVILKSGTIIEEYTFKSKSDSILIERGIIDNNPDYFLLIDWKAEMISYMKANKIAGPAQLSKKLIPFIEQMFIIVNSETKEVIIEDNKLKDIEKDYNRKLTDLSLREKSFELKEKELIIRENKLESELLKNNKVKVEHRKVDDSDIVEFLTYIRDDYYRSGFTKNLEFFKKYGYTYDNNGIYKNK